MQNPRGQSGRENWCRWMGPVAPYSLKPDAIPADAPLACTWLKGLDEE